MRKSAYYVGGEDSHDLFPELAATLFYFTKKLYDSLVEQGVGQVFFLSREGQPMMRMFEMYCKQVGGEINSHYLEVSRRSTLLPSLAPLAGERFETLFRQYRRISLLEFLSSLGLEEYIEGFAQSLGMSKGAEEKREEDFPTSATFTALKTLPQFCELYESERVARRNAFIAYLSNLSGGVLPERLVIVDVGWKGTIQDNLFAMLCRDEDTSIRSITGFYVGLVAEGAAEPRNDKHGLLFSSVGNPTSKFRIFNENRALFEVMLAADHGSIISYEIDAGGGARAIRGQFDEGEMLASEVFPAQRKIFSRFEDLVEEISISKERRRLQFDDVVRAHSRMVFNPTLREREWFLSVFHVENFGVFERSSFSVEGRGSSLWGHICFLAQLIRRHEPSPLGFWPWSTIRERGGVLPAAIYALIRRLQR